MQGANNGLRCWSVAFKDDIFHMWLEDKLTIKYAFEDKEEYLPEAINFYLRLKKNLEKSLAAIEKLHEPHKANMRKYRYSQSPPLLSKLVDPTILRLTQSEHNKGMASLGPFDVSNSESK
ncbi:MAG: hypothetical protein EXX96DRAFT_651954 [Benjaminiella poitrasii]|nr:MAG: hypothetical protein EXX96DRAFT_651954 [Benjaminiella poitrasii]